MKFYPCPDPTKNHPNILFYKEFKRIVKSSNFLMDKNEIQTDPKKFMKILLISYNLSGIDPYNNSLTLDAFFKKI